MRRYHVDGYEFPPDDTGAQESNLAGDGQFPPFYIFDMVAQDNLPGEYRTRADAERVRDLIEPPT